MDLYISPMSCSFAVHVVCIEAGVTPNIHQVDRKAKTFDNGRDYLAIAPKGNVPVISLPQGGVLSESTAVLQYLADQTPEAKLAPPAGTLERYRLIEWLNFITTELHKKHLWPVFSSKTTSELKAFSREHAPATLAYVDAYLAQHDFLVGDRFTIADAYMFWALLVAPHGGISLEQFPALTAYVARMQERPSVKAALAHDYPLYMREAAAGTAPQSITPG